MNNQLLNSINFHFNIVFILIATKTTIWRFYILGSNSATIAMYYKRGTFKIFAFPTYSFNRYVIDSITNTRNCVFRILLAFKKCYCLISFLAEIFHKTAISSFQIYTAHSQLKYLDILPRIFQRYICQNSMVKLLIVLYHIFYSML